MATGTVTSSLLLNSSIARPIALLAALGMMSGCATMMAGGPDRLPVSTNPSGATVFVDNAPVGQTPVMVTLDRAKPKAVIRLEKPGFEPITITREKTMNGWIIGNALFGGVIGMVIDVATNNASKFEDDPIAVGFGANPPPGPESDPRLADCQRRRQRQLLEASKIPEKRQRMVALRAVQTCS